MQPPQDTLWGKRQIKLDLLVQYPPFPLSERNNGERWGTERALIPPWRYIKSFRSLDGVRARHEKRDNIACINGSGHFGRWTAKVDLRRLFDRKLVFVRSPEEESRFCVAICFLFAPGKPSNSDTGVARKGRKTNGASSSNRNAHNQSMGMCDWALDGRSERGDRTS